MNVSNRIWLFNRTSDLLLLFIPVWLCWILCFSLTSDQLDSGLPLWVWVVVVMGIDVSHVWSTIFRTYLDKEEFQNHSNLLKIAPLASMAMAFGIAFVSIDLFWRLLAYLALFHFIKQQFGFMQLYRARTKQRLPKKVISDKFIIYLGMLYPVFYWHLNYDRQFSWFVQDDFVSLNFEIFQSSLPMLNLIGQVFYFASIAGWLLEDLYRHQKMDFVYPIGKYLWVLTTSMNWYLGIIYFNSDIAFTLTNVVAHGIPYFALIYFYQKGKEVHLHKPKRKVPLILTIIGGALFLAFFEEYLWDMLLYADNPEFFGALIAYPMTLLESHWTQALALALLSMPQVTHYILDGFIWKFNHKNPHLKTVLIS